MAIKKNPNKILNFSNVTYLSELKYHIYLLNVKRNIKLRLNSV